MAKAYNAIFTIVTILVSDNNHLICYYQQH